MTLPRMCSLVVLAAGAVLAGCGNNESQSTSGTLYGGSSAGSTDFNRYVSSVVNSTGCDTATPQAINATNFTFDDTTPISVDTLAPCAR